MPLSFGTQRLHVQRVTASSRGEEWRVNRLMGGAASLSGGGRKPVTHGICQLAVLTRVADVRHAMMAGVTLMLSYKH